MIEGPHGANHPADGPSPDRQPWVQRRHPWHAGRSCSSGANNRCLALAAGRRWKGVLILHRTKRGQAGLVLGASAVYPSARDRRAHDGSAELGDMSSLSTTASAGPASAYLAICTLSRGSRHSQCERPWSPALRCPQAVSLLQPGRASPGSAQPRPGLASRSARMRGSPASTSMTLVRLDAPDTSVTALRRTPNAPATAASAASVALPATARALTRTTRAPACSPQTPG